MCFPVRGGGGGGRSGEESRRNNISERINSICKGPRKGTVHSQSRQFFWKAADKEGSQEKGGELVSGPVRALS